MVGIKPLMTDCLQEILY